MSSAISFLGCVVCSATLWTGAEAVLFKQPALSVETNRRPSEMLFLQKMIIWEFADLKGEFVIQ